MKSNGCRIPPSTAQPTRATGFRFGGPRPRAPVRKLAVHLHVVVLASRALRRSMEEGWPFASPGGWMDEIRFPQHRKAGKPWVDSIPQGTNERSGFNRGFRVAPTEFVHPQYHPASAGFLLDTATKWSPFICKHGYRFMRLIKRSWDDRWLGRFDISTNKWAKFLMVKTGGQEY